VQKTSSIGTRLREERKRLGFTVEAFAQLGNASKRSMIEWEKEGEPTPNAVTLYLWSEAGADVGYIITGRKTAPEAAHKLQQPAVYNELLAAVMEAVEEILVDRKIRLPAAKKAMLVTALYEDARGKGAVDRATVLNLVKLAA
jgi:transcriptional regulator with XRE-family HTH domain